MKKFVLKLVILAAVFWAFDKLFLVVAHYSAEAEVDKRLEYLVNGDINKDIIVVGSSRGSRDVIAKQIETKTGLSAYNLCYPGSNVFFHKFIVETLYKFNKPPKYLLLVVDDDEELIPCEKIIFRKDRLYPLIKYPYIGEALAKEEGKDILLSKLLVLYRLNKYNFDLRKKRFTPLDSIKSCGSMPVSWRRKDIDWHFNPEKRVYSISKEDNEKVKAFKDMVKLIKSNNSKLIVVFPPQYMPFSKSFKDRIETLCGSDVSYYVYDLNNPVYRNKDYYYDHSHLDKKGAVIFTDELINFLEKEIFHHK